MTRTKKHKKKLEAYGFPSRGRSVNKKAKRISKIFSDKEITSLEKYDKYIEKQSKKFRLAPLDFHNLYDYMHMANMEEGLRETLKLNNMLEWFDDFFIRIEKIVVPEFYDETKKYKEERKKNAIKWW